MIADVKAALPTGTFVFDPLNTSKATMAAKGFPSVAVFFASYEGQGLPNEFPKVRSVGEAVFVVLVFTRDNTNDPQGDEAQLMLDTIRGTLVGKQYRAFSTEMVLPMHLGREWLEDADGKQIVMGAEYRMTVYMTHPGA
jgi:hypothetical protein